MNTRKLVIVGASLALAAATVPLAFVFIKHSTLLTIYLLFKLWMFVGVPLVVLYVTSKKKN